MNRVVIGALYVVILGSMAYAALTLFVLIDLWKIKMEIGTFRRDLLNIWLAIVVGAGVPYGMVRYLRKQA